MKDAKIQKTECCIDLKCFNNFKIFRSALTILLMKMKIIYNKQVGRMFIMMIGNKVMMIRLNKLIILKKICLKKIFAKTKINKVKVALILFQIFKKKNYKKIKINRKKLLLKHLQIKNKSRKH